MSGMQPAVAGKEQTAGERPGATLCFSNAKPVRGVPFLPSNLLERNPLAGNDQETKKVDSELTIVQDVVTF